MVTGFGANRCTWLHINFGRVSHGAQTLCVVIALLLHYLLDSMVFGLFCGGFVKVYKFTPHFLFEGWAPESQYIVDIQDIHKPSSAHRPS
jgi:hypothetical protein